jgi:Leucine-rich repeat (LRR) protein
MKRIKLLHAFQSLAMKFAKIAICITACLILCVACEKDLIDLDNHLPMGESFTIKVLPLDDSNDDVVRIAFEVKAKTLTIDWGDGIINSFSGKEEYLCEHQYTASAEIQIVTATSEELTELKRTAGIWKELNVGQLKNLSQLYCIASKMDSLNVDGCTELAILDCSLNNLRYLDVLGCAKLKELHCSDNYIQKLYTNNCVELNKIDCSFNGLTDLNVSHNTALSTLYCEYNFLLELNLQHNTALMYLNCVKNQLANLDVGNNTMLQTLNIGENQIANLDVSSTKLELLDCTYNLFDASALNRLFEGLPTEKYAYYQIVFIRGNSGSDECDRSIATKKSWEVNDENIMLN